MLDGSDASDVGVTAAPSDGDFPEQQRLQRADIPDDDEVSDDESSNWKGASMVILSGGDVGDEHVAAGSTREWSSGSSSESKQGSSAEKSAETYAAKEDDADQQQEQYNDQGASALLDLLVRASEELVEQKRPRDAEQSFRPLMAVLRGGGLTSTSSSTSSGSSASISSSSAAPMEDMDTEDYPNIDLNDGSAGESS
jgi:hypothetical protein